MRVRSLMIACCFGFLIAACGGDDSADIDAAAGGDDASTSIDAAAGGTDDAAGGGGDDAAGSGGGLQFCGDEGDPDCPSTQECCADGVCRDSCGDGGGTGAYQCDCTEDCFSGRICCQTSEETFCTRKQDCDNFGGEEVTSCT
jgi:hypothetical protein